MLPGLRLGGRHSGRAVRDAGPLTVVAFAVAAAITAVFALNTQLGDPGSELTELLGAWGNAVGGVLCAAVCLAQARRAGADRLAWFLIGLGVASWALGNAYFSVAFIGAATVPSPSPADLLFMGLYPLAYVGIVLLARRRMRHLGVGLWLDGLISTVAATALLGVFVLSAVIDAYDGKVSAAMLVNIAFPIGDLLLLVLAAAAIVLGAPWLSRGTLAGSLAALAFVLSDSVYVVGNANGTYAVGGILDVGWLLGALLAAYAAIVWDPRVVAVAPAVARARGEATVIVPIVSGLLAVGLLLIGVFTPVKQTAELAASVALVLVVVRMGISLQENRTMLAASEREATSDPLTGLGNRRRLFADLARLGWGADTAALGLVVFDLDGFKTYNDTYGHGAGDRLLCRIADQLVRTLGERGRGYRLGGDEFCALVTAADGDVEQIGAEIADRLAQCGEGFQVTASYGAAATADATGPDDLMRRADRRMYEEKHSRRPSAATQAVDALLAIVDERHPSLSHHVNGVAALAHAIAERLGVRDAALDAVDHAAALHDVGKVAIPDVILDKRSALNESEWAFMRQHTVIGERVLLAVPSLRSAAPLVRASHESWDGSGYPDGRRGEQIPLGAAVIAACDALDAMLEDRPYQRARTLQEATAELRRCSGTQFAPRVVEALVAHVAACAPPLVSDTEQVPVGTGPRARDG